MTLQFDGAVSIRVTKHVPHLRIALRDIVAIVCRVDLKRAGGRVNKLKLKLPVSSTSVIHCHCHCHCSRRLSAAASLLP